MTENEFILQDRLGVIRDTINKYGEENFYLSFSGGKDSTVVHHLVDKALCEQKIKDEQLTEEQRNAWQNALKSVEIQIEIMTPKQLKLFDY